MKAAKQTTLTFIIASFLLALSTHAQQARNSNETLSGQDTVLQSTTFASEEGYILGNLDGQRGWIILGQPATIVSSSLLPQTQALQLARGGDSWAAHVFTTGSSQAVQFDIVMELFASTSLAPGSRLGVGNMDIGFIMGGTGAQAFVEFSGTGGLETMTLPQIIPANPDGSLGWAQIGLQLDYTNQLWSMNIDGLSLADRLPLPPPGIGEEYNYLMLSTGESGPAQVASINIEEIPPLLDTSNQDGQNKTTTNDDNAPSRTSSQSSGGGRGGGAPNAPGNPNGNPPDWTLGKEGDNAAGFVVYSPGAGSAF